VHFYRKAALWEIREKVNLQERRDGGQFWGWAKKAVRGGGVSKRQLALTGKKSPPKKKADRGEKRELKKKGSSTHWREARILLERIAQTKTNLCKEPLGFEESGRNSSRPK